LELATAFSENIIPLIKEFANGLTGKDGVNESLTESEQSARDWGERVRKVIGIVVSLKDELIAVSAVLATVFVVSKIAAAVQGTIVLITSLIKAYNLLKSTAIVAGVASAFALNPLLGVGAVALAASVLAAANALANNSDVSTAGLSVGGAGGFSGTMPNGQPFSTTGSSGGGGGGGGGGGAGGAGGGGTTTGGSTRLGGTGTGTGTGTGAVAAVAKKANEAITNIAGAFDNFTSGTTTLAGIEAASNRPFAFGTSGVNTNTLAGILAASAAPTINVTVNGAIDREGTARTIVETLNSSAYRGTGGAANLVAL
jgi:hypothetical protein